jgi:predicted nucleic acid-binding protein
MGLILDSTVLIAGERRRLTAVAVLEEVSTKAGGQHGEFGISAVSVAELAHGAMRANTQVLRVFREVFLKDLLAFSPIFPVTTAIALRAGHISGTLAAHGTQIGMADLLIGATALELDYGVATANLRHFGSIPGLQIHPM